MEIELCAICLEVLEDLTAELIPCKHTFHIECIRTWHGYADDIKCPTCRRETDLLNIQLDATGKSPPVSIDLKRGFYAKMLEQYCNIEPEDRFLRQENVVENDDSLGEEQQSEEEETLESVHSEQSDDVGAVTRMLTDTLYIIEEPSPCSEQRLIQCDICGEIDNDINKSCDLCECFYHESCSRSLSIETEDPFSWEQCIHCSKKVIHFNMSGNEMYVFNRNNSLIFHGRIRDKSSVMTEQIYEKTLNEELTNLKTAKYKIQQHVRKALHEFNGPIKKGDPINKEHFTSVNKTVSRYLYTLSEFKYKYEQIDYDNEAKYQVNQELLKLGYIEN